VSTVSIQGSDESETRNLRREAGDGDAALSTLREWDGAWADQYLRMSADPWTEGVLPRKMVELVCVALNAACTNLQPRGTRQHIRAALDAGATRDEILTVLKMASLLSIHSCSLGAPLLLEAAQAAGLAPAPQDEPLATPVSEAMHESGLWNPAWDPFFELDPAWTEAYMAAAGPGVYRGSVLATKEVEFLSIALDASITHMYAPGTRRHIKGALAAGATVAEIMAVLKICVAFGGEALHLGVPILAEELARIAH
jgi:alkylhydroperoxidase/carboxymuconolactone decarboxylase family protein YurZ